MGFTGLRRPHSHFSQRRCRSGPVLRRELPGAAPAAPGAPKTLTAPPCPARRCRISSVPAAPGPGRRWQQRGVACPGPSAEARRHRQGREGRRCRAAAAPSSSSRTRRSSSSRGRDAGTVPSKESDGGKIRRAVSCLKQGQWRGAPGSDLD